MQNFNQNEIAIIHYLTGVKKLEKEFIWVSRKTIRGYLFNKYKYQVHTPYMTMYCEDLDHATAMKFRLECYYV